MSVMECWEHIDDPKINWRLETATDRTLFPCEVVLDVDPEQNESKEQFINRTKKIVEDLKVRQIEYKLFHSGGKGYHIHFINWELGEMDKRKREDTRATILNIFKSDPMLKGDKHMILIEGVPNRKTGVPKKEVEL
jgi:hypothetical protein